MEPPGPMPEFIARHETLRMIIEWIADRLGITIDQCLEAIQRLKNLGLLEINDRNDWLVKPEAYSVFSSTPSAAIRKYLRQILQNGIDSLLSDPGSEREIQAMILAIPKSRIPEFRQKMKVFLQESWENLNGENKDELYSLSVQLVPVKNRRTNK